MATRSIVTSQPDIACDICGRRLLRGEHPEVFLAGAERRTVCELCAPRATHEGWLREVDGNISSHRALRGRRGRTLLDRLRQLREPPPSSARATRGPEGQPTSEQHPEPYEFLAGPSLRTPARPASFLAESFGEDGHAAHDGDRPAQNGDDPQPGDQYLPSYTDPAIELAITAFNTSEGPRRIAGVARSLGVPEVTVRHSSTSESFLVVVAWELCWYRYEVDLAEAPASVAVIEQGMELEELPVEDRAPNLTVDERGELIALEG